MGLFLPINYTRIVTYGNFSLKQKTVLSFSHPDAKGIRGIGPYDLNDITTGCDWVAGRCMPKTASWNRDMWTALRDFAAGDR